MKASDLKNKLIAFVADIRVYSGGMVVWGDSHYKIKGPEQRIILETLHPGDILLRRYDHYLGSVAIPGYWSHAALYSGLDKVIHMLGNGITKEDILTFMRCDDIAILRCKDKDRILKAIESAKILLAKKVQYDYDFDSDCPDTLYCSELVNNIYGNFNYSQRMSKWILPDDLVNAKELTVIWAGLRKHRWLIKDGQKGSK